jgi:hypothetical protein
MEKVGSARDRLWYAREAAKNGVRTPGIGEADRRWQTQLVNQLPEELKKNLPSVEEIEAELDCVPDR